MTSRTRKLLALAKVHNPKMCVLRSGKKIDVKISRTKKPKQLKKKAKVSNSKTDNQAVVNWLLNNEPNIQSTNNVFAKNNETVTDIVENSVNFPFKNETKIKISTDALTNDVEPGIAIDVYKDSSFFDLETEKMNKDVADDLFDYVLKNVPNSANATLSDVNTTLTDLAEYTENLPLNNETITRKEICTYDVVTGPSSVNEHVQFNSETEKINGDFIDCQFSIIIADDLVNFVLENVPDSTNDANITVNDVAENTLNYPLNDVKEARIKTFTNERKSSPYDENTRYPGLRRTNISGNPKPLYCSDGSISSEYDSDTSYNPYSKHVDESFSSNDSLKSPTVGFIDQHQDLNEEFLCEDFQENQPVISNNIYENQNPITSQVSQSHKKEKTYNLSAVIDTSKKTALSNKRVWDKKDVCIFCEESVTNFVRHLNRKHSEEIEVAKLLSFKNGSKERKHHIDQLRKRGNFFNNISGATKLKPVRRPNKFAEQPKAIDYLPCKFCFGLFKKNYLRRHLKNLPLRKRNCLIHAKIFKLMRNLYF